jgi:hypothetical protein
VSVVSDAVAISRLAEKLHVVRKITRELFDFLKHAEGFSAERENRIDLYFVALAHMDHPEEEVDDEDDD